MTDSRLHVRGFTLLEVMLVIVLIAGLATATFFLVSGRSEEGNIKTTGLKIQKAINALEEYRLIMKYGYPSQEEGLAALVTKPNYDDEQVSERWRQFLVEADLKDTWGHDLIYRPEDVDVGGKTVTRALVYSVGPNGADDDGGGDDIRSANWPKEGT